MNIQAIGATNQSRQAFAEKTSSTSTLSSTGNSSAASNSKDAVENTGSVTPVETSKAIERNTETPALEKVKQAVQNINKSLQSMSRDLEFSVDSDSNRTIVKVVDSTTKEVIRQIPSQEAIEISKALDTVRGLLIKQQA